MDGGIDGWMWDGGMDGWIGDGWIDGSWMDGGVDEWIGGWRDGVLRGWRCSGGAEVQAGAAAGSGIDPGPCCAGSRD